ncbi:MAG: RluA family pseudouridine synthase [Spirochaetia bacterium]|jgi:23S rRNA pseudouridine1911/1915/1917 synthase|nr:RluA family pseudouridine synthase [Spirochaetia bacterium]
MRINETIEVKGIQLPDIRIDKYISDYCKIISRSQLKSRNAALYINEKPVKLSRMVKNGDLIKIEYDCIPESNLLPENIELDIIYEDENVVIVNKKQGMVVHPAAGNPNGTLANALLFHIEDSSADFDEDDQRPGIVHRLDKDTSGIIITAKNIHAHDFLSRQFSSKKVKKIYLAIVKGKMVSRQGIIETNLIRDRNNRKKFTATQGKGKYALTHYRVLKEFSDTTLVALELQTGRTHQLRVHMQHIGCPIIGDPVYSRKIAKYSEFTMMLHAYILEIKLPDYGLKKFHAPLPERFKKFIKSGC